MLQKAILQWQSASRKRVSWSNSFFPCGLCEPSQTSVEHRVITFFFFLFFFFPSVLGMNVLAIKFDHPSVTLGILPLFGQCLQSQSQFAFFNVLGLV